MKIVFAIVFLILFTEYSVAVAAYQEEISFKQNNGDTFKGYIKGDEWFHWVEDKQGNIIVYNQQTKNYEYGILKKVKDVYELVPSGVTIDKTNNASQAKISNTAIKHIDKKELNRIWKRKRQEALKYLK